MKYEYNGNLNEDERIKKVATEIVQKYPQITIKEAEDIAMLEGKISTDKDTEMEFNRLYNIMLTISDDILRVRQIYTDLVNLVKSNKNDSNIEKYYDITVQIGNFLMGKRDFPILDGNN